MGEITQKLGVYDTTALKDIITAAKINKYIFPSSLNHIQQPPPIPLFFSRPRHFPDYREHLVIQFLALLAHLPLPALANAILVELTDLTVAVRA